MASGSISKRGEPKKIMRRSDDGDEITLCEVITLAIDVIEETSER